jgi:hypothetical protein
MIVVVAMEVVMVVDEMTEAEVVADEDTAHMATREEEQVTVEATVTATEVMLCKKKKNFLLGRRSDGMTHADK